MCSSDEVQEVLAVSALNVFDRLSAWQFWIVAEYSANNGVETPRAVSLSASNFSFPLLSPSKTFFFVADTLQGVEVEERGVEDFFFNSAWSSGTTYPVASVS